MKPCEDSNYPLLAAEVAALAAVNGDRQDPPNGAGDIIARAQGEMALAHLAAIVASSDDAIIGKDLYGIVMSWNKGAETIFGYNSGEMVGTSILRLIPTDRQDEEHLIMTKIKCGDTVDHFETLRLTKDGRLIDVSVTASPIRNSAGVIVGVSKIARDISERKRAEKEIRHLNLDLKQRVVERTSELTAANRELEAFGYSVSHDLRAPLRHVMGYASLLQQNAAPVLSPENLRFLSEICKSAKHMGTLIDDLLAFSRFGKCEIQMAEFDLDPLIAEIVEDFRAETKDRRICWVVHAPLKVRADRSLLRMALFNLIANAVKFTGNCPEARIEIGCDPIIKHETVVFVRDNGAGFDPRYADKLFGVFQRLHDADEFEGTGIGLANVQRIIHRHGGRTWAKGAVGHGATFFFFNSQNSHNFQMNFNNALDRIGATILLVEDDPRDTELTLLALAEFKLANRVTTVSNGLDAMDYLLCRGAFHSRVSGNPLVVLLDNKMPKMSGLEVLKLMKADEKLNKIPVVALTSSRQAPDLVAFYKLGVNAYVVKPVDFSEFMKAVKQVGIFWLAVNIPPPGPTTAPSEVSNLESESSRTFSSV